MVKENHNVSVINKWIIVIIGKLQGIKIEKREIGINVTTAHYCTWATVGVI